MTRHQDTELVREREHANQPRAGSLLTRPLPRALTIPLAVVAVIAALLLALNFQVLHVYQRYFSQDLPDARVPWAALSRTMDEAALKAAFPGLSLRCMPQQTTMGERTCFVALRSANGHPALTLALFLQRGKLNVATLHVPWWAHGRAADALQREFGGSTRASDGGSTALRRWRVAGGVVDMNARRSLNPLAWSAVVWTPSGGS